jgi:3-hydroxyisobutyrate dehydrogenase-like beta-hydroxyacid dehydrogenase
LRKALNYAIKRKELWKYAAKGNAYNLGGFIPPGAYRHNPNLTLYTYDTTRARSLLAEAGYPEGFDVEIITYEACKLECKIMKRMLERDFKPGGKVRLHKKDTEIAMSLPKELAISLPGTSLISQLWNAVAAQGGLDWDHSSIVKVLELMSKTEVCPG